MKAKNGEREITYTPVLLQRFLTLYQEHYKCVPQRPVRTLNRVITSCSVFDKTYIFTELWLLKIVDSEVVEIHPIPSFSFHAKYRYYTRFQLGADGIPVQAAIDLANGRILGKSEMRTRGIVAAKAIEMEDRVYLIKDHKHVVTVLFSDESLYPTEIHLVA